LLVIFVVDHDARIRERQETQCVVCEVQIKILNIFSRRIYPSTIICRTCGWKSVSIRKVLLPANSTPVYLVFLFSQANA